MLKDWYNILVKRFPEVTLAVGGTYALQLQGVDLKREPKDIDVIIVNSYGTDKIEKYRRFFRFLYKYKGPYIDWLTEGWKTSDDDFIEVDGILCFTPAAIIKAKQIFIGSPDITEKGKEKHRNDIIEIEKQLNKDNWTIGK